MNLIDGLGGGKFAFGVLQRLGGESVRAAELGEEDGGGGCDNEGAYASDDDGADGSPPLGCEAGLKLAELVGGTDE